MNCRFNFIIAILFAVPSVPAMAAGFDQDLVRFIKDHCAGCHSDDSPTAGLNFDKLENDLASADLLRRWTVVHDRVASGEMPPKSEVQPKPDEAEKFLSQLGLHLTNADTARRQPVLRRLNRNEHENTLSDLFGIRIQLKEILPEDGSAYGFDTVGEGLAISQAHLAQYLQAAELAISKTLGPDRKPQLWSVSMPLAKDVSEQHRQFLKTDDGGLVIFRSLSGPIFRAGMAQADGTYRVKIKAKTYQTNDPLIMAVYAGDVVTDQGARRVVGYHEIYPEDGWTEISFEDYLYRKEYYKMVPYRLNSPINGPNRFKGPGLMIGEVSVEGPMETWPYPSREKLLGNLDLSTAGIGDAREILTRLLPQAYRRPVTPDEVEPHLALAESLFAARRPFVDGLTLGLKSILCSPDFLLREEPASADRPGEISAHALASRLSYFLWSSMPDAELFQLADSGKLLEPEVLHAQVERMLEDPKSQRFVVNFTGQWLRLREIDFTEPDARLYPEFDEMLRHYIVEETHRFFREILDKNESVLNFVDSDWAMLNERLAMHYQVPDVYGLEIRRVDLPKGSLRGGVITQTSVLKITANGTSTSPVVRGNWVLTNILGTPSPPPPKNVPGLEPDARGATTIRELLEKHRNIASCAVCHNKIDPPGQALESFDPIGALRQTYRTLGPGKPTNFMIDGQRVKFKLGEPVDSTGRLSDGSRFSDIRDFKKLLLQNEPQVLKCLTEKLLIYSLGRPLGFSDRPAVKEIVQTVGAKKYGFRSLIHEIVQSRIFRAI